jgi:hypothetical protein
MDTADTPQPGGQTNIRNSTVGARDIAGRDIFNIEGGYHLNSGLVTELRKSPFAEAVAVAVDSFIQRMSILSKSPADGFRNGAEMAIAEEEDRHETYYDRNKLSCKRLTLTFTPTALLERVDALAKHFSKVPALDWPYEGFRDFEQFFCYQDTILFTIPEAYGRFEGGSAPGWIGWFAAGLCAALAPVTLGTTALIGVGLAGAAGGNYLGKKRARELQDGAKSENVSKLQEFCDRAMARLASSRQSISDSILFLCEFPRA